jgi:wyosine [tRNA(Phe)-imidazoG37] synthetase (radical SAM superfamily)
MSADIKTGSRLSVVNHDRSGAGLTYVYPVVSRRAAGVSIGVNLNVNNACNWRCIYCQVPGLQRGAPPPVDLALLKTELTAFLGDVLQGDFMQRSVPEGARRLNDIAFSGNGEPTSAAQFADAVAVIGEVRQALQVSDDVKTVLITNGSLMHRKQVQKGVAALRSLNGEVWFKLDSATREGIRRMNDAPIGPERVARNLSLAAGNCPTWVQTCVLAIDGHPPSGDEVRSYLQFLADRVAAGVPLKGVLLYGLARQSHQPEASRLSRLPDAWLDAHAGRLRELGLEVRVTP